MSFVLLSLFILVPLIEIGVFIEVGGFIGIWPTLAVIMLSAIAGSALIHHQGLAILAQVQDIFAAGRLPIREIFDGICLLLAGALLLTPGLVTDAFGTLLLVPIFRNLIRTVMLTHFLDRKKVGLNGGAPQGHSPKDGGGPGTIEGTYTVSRSDQEPHHRPSIDDRKT